MILARAGVLWIVLLQHSEASSLPSVEGAGLKVELEDKLWIKISVCVCMCVLYMLHQVMLEAMEQNMSADGKEHIVKGIKD